MQIVGAPELTAAPERRPPSERLGDRGRNDESDESEICRGEKREPRDEECDGDEDERAQRDREREAAPRRPLL